jgi:hypothetical protein
MITAVTRWTGTPAGLALVEAGSRAAKSEHMAWGANNCRFMRPIAICSLLAARDPASTRAKPAGVPVHLVTAVIIFHLFKYIRRSISMIAHIK